MLKLYNTLTRKKEDFKSLHKGKVGMYVCGPTVYWYQHIGNLRTYVFSDVLKRILSYDGFKVKQVMNVTDVGHLTSDSDEGEDKIEKAAKREGKTAKEISNYYLKIFKEDFKKLNISEPNVWCKATEHIKEQIGLIKILEKKGYVYKTSDGIYFDTSKFKEYGELAKLNVEGLKAGKRVGVGEKKNKTDFALWKFSEKSGVRQQEWKSPWGVGFPGWHLECSAMSMKYLGKHFDIHTGGTDHIQIHHTNEIAQSEAATGKKFVNYWMHAGWLLFKGEKVSKSEGGLYTISELEKKGFSPLDFRYLCLTKHYKKPLNFSIKLLNSSKEAYQRLKNIIAETRDRGTNKKYLKDFEEAMNDDLNTPRALQVLWKLLRDKKAKGKLGTVKKMDEVLGLDLLKKEKSIKIKVLNETLKIIGVATGTSIIGQIEKLVEERNNARKNKDWKKADEIRAKIKKLGYAIDDTAKGSIVKKLL